MNTCSDFVPGVIPRVQRMSLGKYLNICVIFKVKKYQCELTLCLISMVLKFKVCYTCGNCKDQYQRITQLQVKEISTTCMLHAIYSNACNNENICTCNKPINIGFFYLPETLIVFITAEMLPKNVCSETFDLSGLLNGCPQLTYQYCVHSIVISRSDGALTTLLKSGNTFISYSKDSKSAVPISFTNIIQFAGSRQLLVILNKQPALTPYRIGESCANWGESGSLLYYCRKVSSDVPLLNNVLSSTWWFDFDVMDMYMQLLQKSVIALSMPAGWFNQRLFWDD